MFRFILFQSVHRLLFLFNSITELFVRRVKAATIRVHIGAELPWERAADGEPRYEQWCAWAARGAPGAAPPAGPWRKVGAAARALLARALHPAVERRLPLSALLRHRWTEDFDGESLPAVS